MMKMSGGVSTTSNRWKMSGNKVILKEQADTRTTGFLFFGR